MHPEDPMDFYLCALAAETILAAAERGDPEKSTGSPAGGRRDVEVSLDLNLSTASVGVDSLNFYHSGCTFLLSPLRSLVEDRRKVFRALAPSRGEPVEAWEPVAVYDEAYYQLVATGEAPTMEIDGIQMHLTAQMKPFAAAGAFARAAVRRPGARVFDTCGGLGYTGIQALRLDAARVDSCELSAAVLRLRDRNPWSRLAADSRLNLEQGDVFRSAARLPVAAYDAVIHDPPRQALAPELYSDSFYLRLRELLKPGGRLFHYTGNPGGHRPGPSLAEQTAEKLCGMGFSVEPRSDVQGLVAVRGRRRRGGPL